MLEVGGALAVAGHDGPAVRQRRGSTACRRSPSARSRRRGRLQLEALVRPARVVGDLRAPRASRCRSRDRRTRARRSSRRPRRPPGPRRRPRRACCPLGTCSIAASSERAGHVDQVARLVVDVADRDRDRGVGVPALDDRPAVERQDVALFEDDGRPGCRARSRRWARCRSPRGSRGSRGSSSGRRGRSSTSRATSSISAVVTPGLRRRGCTRSCISATTRPALRIERDLVGVLARDHRSSRQAAIIGDVRGRSVELARRSRPPAARTPRPRRPRRRPGEQAALAVQVDERLGLLVVELEPAPDRLPVSSSRPRPSSRSIAMSVGTSRSMTRSSGWCAPRIRSSSSAWFSVRGNPSSTKPCSTSRRVREALLDHVDHDLVGDELAPVHELLGLAARRRRRPRPSRGTAGRSRGAGCRSARPGARPGCPCRHPACRGSPGGLHASRQHHPQVPQERNPS